MKKFRSKLLVLLTLLTFIGGGYVLLNSNVSNPVSCKKTVGMWVLMLWFDDSEANFYPWNDYVRHFPVKGRYDSWDASWVEYTIDSAVRMGVDYLILDNTNGVFRHNGKFDRVIQAYIKAIERRRINLKVVIAKGYSIFEKKDLDLLNSSVEHLRQYFSKPSYLKVDGKPQLILYINSDDNIVSLSKRLSLNKFDFSKYLGGSDRYGYKNYFPDLAIRYSSGADRWIEDVDGVYGWQFLYPQVENIRSMGVMPGWNRSHNKLTGSEPVYRLGGGIL
jgi:hypothetical protein